MLTEVGSWGGREEHFSVRMTAMFFHVAQVVGNRLHLPRGKGSAGPRQVWDNSLLQGGSLRGVSQESGEQRSSLMD